MRFRSTLACLGAASLAIGPALALSAPAAASQLSQLQAKASQIESQISSDTQQIGVLGQRYDEALDQINTLNAEITATKDQIAADQQHVAVDKVRLRTVAINSYIHDGTIEQSNPLFSGNQRTYEAQQEYGKIASGNLDEAVASLHTAEVQLNAAEVSLTTQQQQATAVANAAAQEKAAAQAQQNQLNAALGQVKGQIGVLVQQEQAAAAAAAAAKTQSVLTAGATFPPPPPAGGAGTAVSAAESQLGVPYVWGGTDPAAPPAIPPEGSTARASSCGPGARPVWASRTSRAPSSRTRLRCRSRRCSLATSSSTALVATSTRRCTWAPAR